MKNISDSVKKEVSKVGLGTRIKAATIVVLAGTSLITWTMSSGLIAVGVGAGLKKISGEEITVESVLEDYAFGSLAGIFSNLSNPLSKIVKTDMSKWDLFALSFIKKAFDNLGAANAAFVNALLSKILQGKSIGETMVSGMAEDYIQLIIEILKKLKEGENGNGQECLK